MTFKKAVLAGICAIAIHDFLVGMCVEARKFFEEKAQTRAELKEWELKHGGKKYNGPHARKIGFGEND